MPPNNTKVNIRLKYFMNWKGVIEILYRGYLDSFTASTIIHSEDNFTVKRILKLVGFYFRFSPYREILRFCKKKAFF